MLRNIKSIQHDPLNYLASTWRAHGDVVQFPIPKPASYFVASPQGARDVLVSSHPNLSKRTIQYTSLSLVTGEGLLTADTNAWRPRRRMLQPAFHKELVELTDIHIERALTRLQEQWQSLERDGTFIVDIDQAMMELALDITGGALFGIDLSGDAYDITQATLQALHGVVGRAQNPLALPLGIPTPSNRSMRSAVKRLDAAVNSIIKLRKLDLLPDDAPIRDMLDVLLDPDLEQPLTSQQIRDEIATFIVAGHETVASALTWSLYLLSRHPGEQDALAHDNSRAPLVFDEALRLYPPAWVITRKTTAPIEISGHTIPQAALVIVSPWVTHRHPDAWTKPDDFVPDRFSTGMTQLGYLPFGQGPRLCIGKEMALREGSQVLAGLINAWRFEPVHHQDVAVEASVTLRPAGGLPLRISKRS